MLSWKQKTHFPGSSFHESFHESVRESFFHGSFHVLFHESCHQRFDGSLHDNFYQLYFLGGLAGSSWKLSFTEATSMEAIFTSFWMGPSMKASKNFPRKHLPGFGCFRRTCRSNLRTFDGNGSRSSFGGSVHGSRLLLWTLPWKSW